MRPVGSVGCEEGRGGCGSVGNKQSESVSGNRIKEKESIRKLYTMIIGQLVREGAGGNNDICRQ